MILLRDNKKVEKKDKMYMVVQEKKTGKTRVITEQVINEIEMHMKIPCNDRN